MRHTLADAGARLYHSRYTPWTDLGIGEFTGRYFTVASLIYSSVQCAQNIASVVKGDS
jgi:hypothetical protein